MARAVAVCTNGPFEGLAFSVELNEDGTAPELKSRLDLHDGDSPYHSIGTLSGSHSRWTDSFLWTEHVTVLEYRI